MTGLRAVHERTGKVLAAELDVPATFIGRGVGLMFRRTLEPGRGMWINPCEGGSIHMLFMRFPIDAVFLDSKERVKKVYPKLPVWRGVVRLGRSQRARAAGRFDGRAGPAARRPDPHRLTRHVMHVKAGLTPARSLDPCSHRSSTYCCRLDAVAAAGSAPGFAIAAVSESDISRSRCAAAAAPRSRQLAPNAGAGAAFVRCRGCDPRSHTKAPSRMRSRGSSTAAGGAWPSRCRFCSSSACPSKAWRPRGSRRYLSMASD